MRYRTEANRNDMMSMASSILVVDDEAASRERLADDIGLHVSQVEHLLSRHGSRVRHFWLRALSAR